MGRGPGVTMEDARKVIAAKVLDPVMPDTAIAAIVGRSPDTVGRLAKRFEGVIAEYARLKQRDIIADLDVVRRGYLARLADPEVIEACSGPQAGVVYGILTDKLLLESGRPTNITLSAQVDVSLPDVLGRLQKAIEGRQATTSGSGQVDDGSL